MESTDHGRERIQLGCRCEVWPSKERVGGRRERAGRSVVGDADEIARGVSPVNAEGGIPPSRWIERAQRVRMPAHCLGLVDGLRKLRIVREDHRVEPGRR